MSIACIKWLSVLLQDKDDSVMLRVLGPEMHADHALQGIKCLLGYMDYDVLAGISTAILNKLVGTTGLAQNLGWERNEVTNMMPFRCVIFNKCDLLIGSIDSARFQGADSEMGLESMRSFTKSSPLLRHDPCLSDLVYSQIHNHFILTF
jgi:hypothetical protein